MQVVKVQQPENAWAEAKKLSDILRAKEYNKYQFEYNNRFMNPNVTEEDISKFKANPDWQRNVVLANPELAKLKRDDNNALYYDALQNQTLTELLKAQKRNALPQDFAREKNPFSFKLTDLLGLF